jgi:AcrR family transcriptional regulator
MRVTAATKAITRERILETAQRLFAGQGYEATTTRDIAREAGIATGTLFNYFATKEDILTSQAHHALDRARADFERRAGEAESLDEALFAWVAVGLRRLKPLRKHLPALLQSALSPLAATPTGEGVSLRVSFLETVVDLGEKHGIRELPPVALQLCWTLYTGVLVFWASDKSPRQEDTLALVDQSLRMFVAWLGSGECGMRISECGMD